MAPASRLPSSGDSVRNSPDPDRYICANGAEGEPGSFKDRWLLRLNPYLVLEGLAIAAFALGAKRAFIGVKQAATAERERVETALRDLQSDGIGGNIEVVLGSGEYLFGEEKALLEVVEGGLPLPRVFPPYMHGLFSGTYGGPGEQGVNPTAVNNVEALAHVTRIISKGSQLFRSAGTPGTPGTMIFTVSGDVRRPFVREMPLGLTLRRLIEDEAGGPPGGRRVKAVFPGLAGPPLTGNALDTVLDFDSMRAAGSALGSAGFVVYDEQECMVQAAYVASRFLYVESCNQCAPCKLGSRRITEALTRLLAGEGNAEDLTEMEATAHWVNNAARCYLTTSEQLVTLGLLAAFRDEFQAHVDRTCSRRHDLIVPKMLDYVEGQGFVYDTEYRRKQPDWTYT